MENKNYGGLESEFTAYETAEIVVLPVPYDGTSTWLKGADKGPDAILEASANMELYDIETDSEVYTHGIATLEPVTEASSPEAMSQEVEKQVDKILTDKKFPVILGGEHSVSIGAFRAFAKHYDKFSVLQLDAHSDMRSEYEGSTHNHACVMARAKEVATVAQVGIRSSAIEEKKTSCRIVFSTLTTCMMPKKATTGCTWYRKNYTTTYTSRSTWTFSTQLLSRQQEPRNLTDFITEKY